MDIILTENVSFSYNHQTFIKGLRINIREGEFVGLIGPNGSGKSTVLKLAAGILRPDSGRVLLWGRDISTYNGKDRAKLISYLPQMLNMKVPFKVSEIVRMGLYPYDIPPGQTPEEALHMVGLSEKKDAYITELSGGERRRVYLAMTLLQGAGLLLLDEPLANLDIRYQVDLLGLLRDLRDNKGISIFMALHDIIQIEKFDRLYIIKEGNIIAEGSPEDIICDSLLSDLYGVNIRVIRDKDGGFLFRI
ncbi:MAG: ABC transporter ATP-binding protein [Nitrospirae bacterium]|nr:ABC transporter ATP-binding protein [Nitrospirota bacterium]